ncbi:MAG: RNA polymerase sigma factor [Opitutales bacterium]|nr:RNA polymerase sigma factor [Opitutales bacterium]
MNDRELLQAGFKYAYALCHNYHEAEDLVQQAWFRLHRKYGKVETKALLFKTIRNLIMDRIRRDKVVSFESVEDREFASSAEVRASKDDVEAILSGLRREERESLYLNVVEGYTAQEIADQTGSPRGSILSLIHRAKKKLREGLDNSFDRAN